MRRTPDRRNTTVLTLLSLLLIGSGAYGLARGYDAMGDRRADDPVLGDALRDFVSANEDWFWPLAAALSLLLAWVALRWLVAQVHTPAVSRLPVHDHTERGSTTISATGAAAALAGDVEEYAEVRSARARVVGEGDQPALDLTVDVHDDADVAAVRARIEEHALPRLAAALDAGDLRALVHVRLAEPAGRAIR